MPDDYHAHGLQLYTLAHTTADPNVRRAYLKAAAALFVAARDIQALESAIHEQPAPERRAA
jgi:hypothetical protein